MDNWNEKFKEKLGEYNHQEEVSDEKVANFFDRLDSPSAEKTERKSPILLRIAASVAIFIAVGYTVFQLSVTSVVTGLGKFANVELPDGSIANLKYQSSITYNSIGWWFNRHVEFEGEGFFEVERGSKFSVISLAGTTSVLGTSFNVKTRGTRYEVKCFTGRVAVVSGSDASTLTPGNATLFEEGKKIRDYDFDQQTPNWNQGEIHFDDQPLRVVLDEMERVFDLSIEYADSLGTIRYTGFFPTNDLEMALKLTCEPLDVDYRIEGKTVALFLKED